MVYLHTIMKVRIKKKSRWFSWKLWDSRLFKGSLFPNSTLIKPHVNTTLGHICLSTFRPNGGTLHWKMTPVVPVFICMVHIHWKVHLAFVYILKWTHYIIHANASNLFPCFCNILVMCLFIWKQIGFVIMETFSIFCFPLCAMMLSRDLWEVKGRALNGLFYCPKVPGASRSLVWYIKTFLLH